MEEFEIRLTMELLGGLIKYLSDQRKKTEMKHSRQQLSQGRIGVQIQKTFATCAKIVICFGNVSYSQP